MTENTKQGRIELRHYIKVRDDAGGTLAVIPFEEAVTIVRGGLRV